MEQRKRARSWEQASSTEDVVYKNINFDEPVPLEEDEQAASFPLDAFPRSFREPIEEVTRHYRVKELLPALCALVINSAAVGRGIMTQSNVRRTYANLYALVGAESGTGKSVVFDEFFAPLNELQIETLKEFNAGQKPRADAELRMLKQEIQNLLKIKKDPKKFDFSEDNRHERLSELLQQQAVLEDKLQFASRLWCSDFTSEALAMLLASSNEQMAVLSDEGGLALYNMLGRYTKGEITDDILLCKAKTVNSHAVDRVSRTPIVLSQPCVSLLLLVQPDLLYKAFSNQRLLVGGFLARCLATDSKLEVQYENEETLPVADKVIMGAWNRRIRKLVKNFRFATEVSCISVAPEVRVLSRKFQNEIVDRVRRDLSDISAFALRWVERAWEISLNLHSGLHEVECCREVLTEETFSNAIRIVRFFINEQLAVLQAGRMQASDAVCERLKEVFHRNGAAPITLRDLGRRHGVDRNEVISGVKNHPNIFGATIAHRVRGGVPSCLIFLRSNPPPGWNSQKEV